LGVDVADDQENKESSKEKAGFVHFYEKIFLEINIFYYSVKGIFIVHSRKPTRLKKFAFKIIE